LNQIHNVTSSGVFTVSRPFITIRQNNPSELILSWDDPAFSLQTSSDLNTWIELSPPGLIEKRLIPAEGKAFFRLLKR